MPFRVNIYNDRITRACKAIASRMWDMASERETYKWLSPLPKEAKIKLGTAELIMSHAKIDRQGNNEEVKDCYVFGNRMIMIKFEVFYFILDD